MAGHDVALEPEAVKGAIGYMSQKFSLYLDLPARENLLFFGGAYGLSGAPLRARAEELLEKTHLGALSGATTGDLPGGIRQRLALACAILHRPEIVFLDEPTAGVDPAARRAFWALIRELATGGPMTFRMGIPLCASALRLYEISRLTLRLSCGHSHVCQVRLPPVVGRKRILMAHHCSKRDFKDLRSCSTSFISSAYFSSDISGNRNKVKTTSLPVPFDRTRMGTYTSTPEAVVTKWSRTPNLFFSANLIRIGPCGVSTIQSTPCLLMVLPKPFAHLGMFSGFDTNSYTSLA